MNTTRPHATTPGRPHSVIAVVSGVNRTKIDEVTLDVLRTRQSLVKGERLVRHEMRTVLTERLGTLHAATRREKHAGHRGTCNRKRAARIGGPACVVGVR